jgi:ABC-type multidrug transport system fused ATPase/permease subunit
MDRNALWFFIIAILAGIVGMVQNYLLSSAAAKLTENLRSLYFSVILRQDSMFIFIHSNLVACGMLKVVLQLPFSIKKIIMYVLSPFAC